MRAEQLNLFAAEAPLIQPKIVDQLEVVPKEPEYVGESMDLQIINAIKQEISGDCSQCGIPLGRCSSCLGKAARLVSKINSILHAGSAKSVNEDWINKFISHWNLF